MAKLIDLTGRKFSHLLVLRRSGSNEGGKVLWLCRCDCGKELPITGDGLRGGSNHSCGCMRGENQRIRNKQKRIAENKNEIPLGKGRVALVDPDDYDMLIDYGWHCAGSKNHLYAATQVQLPDGKEKSIQMHRMIMNTPDGMDTDHINGNGLDNRKSNLRISTHQENMRNRRKRSKYKGIDFIKKRGVYGARIKVDGKTHHFGYFISDVAAACVYDYAAIKHFGEFACLNFPDGQPLSIDEIENHRYKGKKTSSYKGVCWHESAQKWRATISENYKQVWSRTFHTEIEAAEAYKQEKLKREAK